MITFVKYNLIQLLVYALDLVVFFLAANGLDWSLAASNVLAKSCAGTFAFVSHKYFTFGHRCVQSLWREVVSYAVLLALNIPLSTGVLYLLKNLIPVAAAKVLSDVMCMGVNFFLSKHVVFKKR